MTQETATPKIAVLVLNYNGAHFLNDCFQSILKDTSIKFDTYLIDNASKDSSVDLIRKKYPSVIIVQNLVNLGFAGAYDKIIRELDYEYLVLLNNDTVVHENWLEALVKVAESDSQIGACGSKILMMNDKKIIDHAGGMLTVIGSGLDRGKWTTDEGQYDIQMEVGFACGCALLIRKSAYLEAGGFHPDYFMYHEDVDVCWKMRLLGYSVLYVPDSVVYHYLGGGISQGDEHPFKTYLCQKNRLANVIVNIGIRRLPLAVLISMIYDFVRVAKFSLKRRWDLLEVLFRAYAVTFRNLNTLWNRRSEIQRRRSVSDRECKEFFAPVIGSALEYRRLTNEKGEVKKHEILVDD